jgi:hypothetical protein
MAVNENNLTALDEGKIRLGSTVRFNDNVFTDDDAPLRTISFNENNSVDLSNISRPDGEGHNPCKPGILKRRENTLTTADAPPIILSDEGLKAGRVSPFLNFGLFFSMTIRSVGVIFGDM